jgi:hypothetical protein
VFAKASAVAKPMADKTAARLTGTPPEAGPTAGIGHHACMRLAFITQDRLAYKPEWSTEKCEKARIFANSQA